MKRDSAVSAVISETLMIALVLILVPMVTISLMNQLPEDRIPTVTIKMSPFDGDSVTLFHKGGDWIKPGAIRITRNGESVPVEYPYPVFDLGNNITVSQVTEGDEICFIAGDAVLFSGVAYP